MASIYGKCPKCGSDVAVRCERASSAHVLSDGSGMTCSGVETCPECGTDVYWSATVAIYPDDVETE